MVITAMPIIADVRTQSVGFSICSRLDLLSVPLFSVGIVALQLLV